MARRDDDGPFWVAVPAILDEADAALFRLAHSERNDVYHEDRHNPALLTPLTWLYLAAVARAFCRQYRPGSGVGGSLEPRVAELARLGYELPEDDMHRGMFEFHAAAKIVTETLVRPLRVELPRLADLLIMDLQLRLSDAAGVVKFLLDEGMPFDRLTFGIYWSQFWEACGADERAQEFDDRRERASEALLTETDQRRRSELQAANEEANNAYIARWHELQRSYKPAASLETMRNVGNLAPRLRTATTIRSLLERYERLDIELRSKAASLPPQTDGAKGSSSL